MAKGKALQPLAGSYGHIQIGDEFEVRESDLKILVANGLAEVVSNTDSKEFLQAEEDKANYITQKQKAVKIGESEATYQEVIDDKGPVQYKQKAVEIAGEQVLEGKQTSNELVEGSTEETEKQKGVKVQAEKNKKAGPPAVETKSKTPTKD